MDMTIDEAIDAALKHDIHVDDGMKQIRELVWRTIIHAVRNVVVPCPSCGALTEEITVRGERLTFAGMEPAEIAVSCIACGEAYEIKL